MIFQNLLYSKMADNEENELKKTPQNFTRITLKHKIDRKNGNV